MIFVSGVSNEALTDADTMRTPEALERGYGGNFDSSVSLGDDNILYDGMPWEGRPHYEVY